MPENKELAIKLQFLEEAQEYLNTIESVLLKLGTDNSSDRLDAALRAAHSIKGGAAMMGFTTLSELAHRFEDFFKVLKTKKQTLEREIEDLLLIAVDYISKVIALNLQGKNVEQKWLGTHVNPVFDRLHEYLGEPPVEDLISDFPDAGQDMVALLFESEVEGCLQRLESVVANPLKPCLLEECAILSQQLAGLGEMLQLNAFASLCNSISQHLESTPNRVEEIVDLALKAWRRSQAAILVGDRDFLPTKIDLPIFSETYINSFTTAEIENILNLDIDGIPNIEIDEKFNIDSEIFISKNTIFGDVADSINSPIESLASQEISREEFLNVQSYNLPELESKTTLPSYVSEKQENTVRVPVKQLEQLNDLFGELTIERNGLELRLGRLRNLVSILNRKVQVLEQSNFRLRNAYDKISTPSNALSYQSPLLAKSNNLNINLDTSRSSDIAEFSGINSKFDILEMDRYSDLHLLSQEVMETIVQLIEVKTDIELNLEDTQQTTRALNRTAKQMQTSLTQVRMRPLSDIVGRFPRALRELCLEYGKNVELKIYGSETLIDRAILEALSDPLMHLLRNAFDHGIETPQARVASGKPEKGVIEIRAAYRGNQTLITIADDGGGIPLEKVREKAKTMGIDDATLETASEKQLLELIFEPGFSTANKVTTLSGRGVGMDVVLTNIKKIRGDIQIDSKVGLGTTFTISVPFTLSVMRVLLIESGGMLIAFPKDFIEEMLLLNSELILMLGDSEILNWEEYLLPLIQLNKWLKFNCPQKIVELEGIATVSEPTVLIVSQGKNLVGLKIDRCWGEQEVAIRQVEGTIAMPPGFRGCTILGDGRIVPLVDVLALLDWIANYQDSFSTKSSASELSKLNLDLTDFPDDTTIISNPKNTILVVDDSINVRKFLALNLEKAGYRVEQAKDGQEAIDKLLGGLQVEAVICDIEMPRLDGYGFLSRIKSEPAFSQLPVAMLTSRSGDKHRKLAMSLGASAYLTKPYKEQELIQTLNQLIQNCTH